MATRDNNRRQPHACGYAAAMAAIDAQRPGSDSLRAATSGFSRVSQARWVAVAVCALLVTLGLGLLAGRRAGCSHHPTNQVCLDTSTYCPHVTNAWIAIVCGVVVLTPTFVGTRFSKQQP